MTVVKEDTDAQVLEQLEFDVPCVCQWTDKTCGEPAEYYLVHRGCGHVAPVCGFCVVHGMSHVGRRTCSGHERLYRSFAEAVGELVPIR
jgi:hypothetical protein